MKSRCLPRDLFEILQKWKQRLPNYSIFFHDDDAVDRLLQQSWSQFPSLNRILKCVLKGAMKIDVWRILVLYKYGGVYTDIDNWPLEQFNEELISPHLSAFFFSDVWQRPSQWFMAMEPHHPIANFTMHQIIENVYNLKDISKPKVVFTTGPHVVKSAYHQFLFNRDGVFTLRDRDFTGMHNKTVRKISSGVGSYITSKYKWDELVPFNVTMNVTRNQRIELESGVQHWTKSVHRNVDQVHRESCQSYLAKLDESETTSTSAS
jgi:mannosyltransferase OCH1-like enzyme